jgi:hypothetical protein
MTIERRSLGRIGELHVAVLVVNGITRTIVVASCSI